MTSGSMRRLLLVIALAAAASSQSSKENDTTQQVSPQPSRTRFLHRLQALFSASSSSSSSSSSTSKASSSIPTATAGSIGRLSPPFPVLGGVRDAWAEEPELQIARRLLDGDHFGLLREMAQSKDLDVIWADPVAARRLLEANPIFKALPGVAALAEKAAEEWTAEDGLSILSRFRAFVTSALAQTMAGMDPSNSMATLERYAHRGGGAAGGRRTSSSSSSSGSGDEKEKQEGRDPILQKLFAEAAAGDEMAARRVHDAVFDELWGDVLDKRQLGFGDGGGGGGGGEGPKEAEATARLREWVRKEEPALWDLMTMDGDPFVTQLMTDPMTPMQVLQDLTNQELQADEEEKEAAAADAAGRR